MTTRAKIGLLAVLLTPFFSFAHADERMFRCEFGVEGGCGYYVGDAAPYMFQNVREMYGANFRYRFDQRWSLQVKGVMHHIAGENWDNRLINMDAVAEFNFFRFGARSYDRRVKPFTPYILVGAGVCLHGGMQKVAAYIPFGVGFKCKLAPRFNIQLAWQNNLYFTDNLENVPELDNTYNLNGTNVFNCDVTGTISLGLTFEFAKDKKKCVRCKN